MRSEGPTTVTTTPYLDTVLVDVTDRSEPMELELGRSSYWQDENLIYLVVDGRSIILDDKTGRQLYKAMMKLGAFLGYDQEP
ncbi:MAG TPA: hypothetical protein VGN82_15480 [Bosea sp. (in: a-proteobacteria)]|jgi:hypothetical protein|uniref:hypothetical protein n=1 Tax=Bosea sp. (in: a-proteobacteria) TaxID=1871050 RepID=UPI002E0E189D|nr:hypothetical protein [Bosea sp. (in: a-proteobacteria)]